MTTSQLSVSNCYVFKSRLQEYAQKAGISTPVYETVKEGPSHEPSFKSTVIVNNVRYDSLPGFFNRKAAEQSAAEIALMELHKSGNMAECIPQPVHETGLCKNLLQEYAQKMNYAIPSYLCNKPTTASNSLFVCTVEVGGIQYIGAAAKNKKEAEIKAARTALLAIQSKASGSELNPNGNYTVLPYKKKGSDSDVRSETAKAIKPKKAEFKKKGSRKKLSRKKGERINTDQNEQGNPNYQEEGCGAKVGIEMMGNANIQGFGEQEEMVGNANNQQKGLGAQVVMEMTRNNIDQGSGVLVEMAGITNNQGSGLQVEMAGSSNNKGEARGVQVEMTDCLKDFQCEQHDGMRLDQDFPEIVSMGCFSASQVEVPGLNQNEPGIPDMMGAFGVQIQSQETSMHVNSESFVGTKLEQGQGRLDVGATNESQIENPAALIRICQDAQAAALVANSSMGAPMTQGVADNPISTAN